jgi:hypothetical protein
MQHDRYKRAHDAHMRARTSDLAVGDLASVKTYVAPRELIRSILFPPLALMLLQSSGQIGELIRSVCQMGRLLSLRIVF